jgi:hypothetical protein
MFALIQRANCTKKFGNRPRIDKTPRGRLPEFPLHSFAAKTQKESDRTFAILARFSSLIAQNAGLINANLRA